MRHFRELQNSSKIADFSIPPNCINTGDFSSSSQISSEVSPLQFEVVQSRSSTVCTLIKVIARQTRCGLNQSTKTTQREVLENQHYAIVVSTLKYEVVSMFKSYFISTLCLNTKRDFYSDVYTITSSKLLSLTFHYFCVSFGIPQKESLLPMQSSPRVRTVDLATARERTTQVLYIEHMGPSVYYKQILNCSLGLF